MSNVVNVDFITKVVEIEVNDNETESLAAMAAVNAAKRADEKVAVAIDEIDDFTDTKKDEIDDFTDTKKAELQVYADNAANSATAASNSASSASTTATQLMAYLATKETLTAPAVDPTLTISGAAADAQVVGDKFGTISENTYNLNNIENGYYYFANDNQWHVSTNQSRYGMSDFIPISPSTKYRIQIIGFGSVLYAYVRRKKIDDTYAVSTYSNTNNRTFTSDADDVGLAVTIFDSNDNAISYPGVILITQGETDVLYIEGVSAKDYVLRHDKKHGAKRYISAVGAMVNTALEYFHQAYANPSNITYQTDTGLFMADIDDANNIKGIQCSEFIQALYKGITWDRSRYTQTNNTLSQWGFITDGIDVTEQDGQPYSRSYYYGTNDPSEIDQNDYPSHDYMFAADLYRYAKNHGYGWELTEIRPNVCPGDFVFSVEEDSPALFYKGIRHVALVLYVGKTNDRLVILEANSGDYAVKTLSYARSFYKYAARYPVVPAVSSYKLLKENIVNEQGTTSSSTTINVIDYTVEYPAGKFYTIKITADIPATKNATIRISDPNNTLIQEMYPARNGNEFIAMFYARSPIYYIRMWIPASTTYEIKTCEIYEGYVPV